MASVSPSHLPASQNPAIRTVGRIFLTLLVLFYVAASIYCCARSISRCARSFFHGTTGADRRVGGARTVKLDDRPIVASLPTVVYGDIKGKDGVAVGECPICLSAVGDVEMVRVLPNCGHLFHVECIDMWLGSHLTCPVCRVGVGPVVGSSDLSSLC